MAAQSKSAAKYTLKGGNTKMFSKMGSHPAKPGVISHSQPGKGAKFMSGGGGKMFAKMGANPAKAGQVSLSQPGVGAKFAAGGKGKDNHMFPKGYAAPAKPR